MPLDNDIPQPHDDAVRRPHTKLVVAAVVTVAMGFIAAVALGAMWLTGQWNNGRSSPTESVDGFLTALLADRDSQSAASFTCQSLTGDLTEALDLLDALPEAGSPGAQMTAFSWDNIVEHSRDAGSAIVTADVTLDLTGETEQWSFALVTGDPDDTWRVCGVVTSTGGEGA